MRLSAWFPVADFNKFLPGLGCGVQGGSGFKIEVQGEGLGVKRSIAVNPNVQ